MHVRFELYTALLAQQSLKVDYSAFMLEDFIEPVNDIAWSNRMMWINARVLQWCQSEDRRVEKWSELCAAVHEWECSRPDSFNPFHYREASGEGEDYYSEIWYSLPEHGTAFTLHRVFRS